MLVEEKYYRETDVQTETANGSEGSLSSIAIFCCFRICSSVHV